MFCRILNQYSTCVKVLLEFHLKFLAPLHLQLSAKFEQKKKLGQRGGIKQMFFCSTKPGGAGGGVGRSTERGRAEYLEK